MYKVEVYGYDGTQSSQQLQYAVPSPVVYYTCLQKSTASEDTSKRQRPPGTLFTLGRKLNNTNDCVVSQEDRSISREHLRLQLVTANKTILDSTELSIKPAPCDRSTPEQIEACQKSNDHMALVATNLGKLGTYRVVVIEQPPADQEQHTQKDDQSMKDDDSATTADSNIIAASQKSLQQLASNENLPLSNITKKLIGNAKAKLELIAENQSVVLNTDDNRNMEHPVILQCGKMGTTVVITKIQIHLIPSGLAKKDLENIQHSLFAIHGVIDPELPDLSTKNSENNWTYLVTNEYKAGFNQLAAWCQMVPFVQVSFVEALLARTSPSSPLPDPTKFAPKPDSKLEFWLHTTPNPNLWKSCTFFSVSFKQDRQYEAIVIAAGGNVHRLYDQDGETILDNDDDVMQQARRLQKNSACFCIGGGRRKFAKLLKDEGVAIISSKELAAAIIEQRMIHNPLSGKPILEKSATQPPIDSMDGRSPETLSTNHNSFEQSQDHATFTGLEKKSEYNNSMKDLDKQSGLVDSNDDTKEEKIQEVTRTKSSDPQRSPENEFPEVNSSNDENGMEISGRESISGEPRPQKDTAIQPRALNRISVAISTNHRNRSVPRMNANEIKEGGWIPALPKKRKQFVRSAEEIKESSGWEEVRYSAPTDLVEGMIVYNSSAISQNAEASNSSAHYKGPNYKRFRKNSVPVPRTKFIELRSVLTKESEYQREMEKQRQAIEEQQRRADELFSEGPTKGRRRRF